MSFEDIQIFVVFVDFDIVEVNIDSYQVYCIKYGFGLWLYIKIYKLLFFVWCQFEVGVIGIICQKISEVEVMVVEGGINDVLIIFNILGQEKFEYLKVLVQKVWLSVVVDNIVMVIGLLVVFVEVGFVLIVFVECDIGVERCGVISVEVVWEFVQVIDCSLGFIFGGIMIYFLVGREVDV